jgi:uncharacterized protein YndB with AHSA1/START domain
MRVAVASVATEPLTTSVRVDAPPAVVFEYFVDAEKMLRWQGQSAEIDPVPGGRFSVDINGVPVRGQFVEVTKPERIVVSWGHAGSDVFPPGSSVVEITFTPDGQATLLEVVHREIPEQQAPQHAIGWRHFLDRLAIAASGGEPGLDPWAENPPR